jgi:hypothetical protein
VMFLTWDSFSIFYFFKPFLTLKWLLP